MKTLLRIMDANKLKTVLDDVIKHATKRKEELEEGTMTTKRKEELREEVRPVRRGGRLEPILRVHL